MLFVGLWTISFGMMTCKGSPEQSFPVNFGAPGLFADGLRIFASTGVSNSVKITTSKWKVVIASRSFLIQTILFLYFSCIVYWNSCKMSPMSFSFGANGRGANFLDIRLQWCKTQLSPVTLPRHSKGCPKTQLFEGPFGSVSPYGWGELWICQENLEKTKPWIGCDVNSEKSTVVFGI